jgi:hypothetical protein
LVPVLIYKILQQPPGNQTPEEASVERTLLKTLSDFVKSAKIHQEQVQHVHDMDAAMRMAHFHPGSVVSPTPAPFTLALLTHLHLALRSLLSAPNMDRNFLRQSLLGCRPRAEVALALFLVFVRYHVYNLQVLHTIVQSGDRLSELAESKVREEWVSVRDTFMARLDDK